MIEGDKIQIKKATIWDYKRVKDIQREGYGRVTWGTLHMLINRVRGGSIYLMVDEEENILGYVEELKSKKEKSVHILNICFYPKEQGKGLGTDLLCEREEDYRKEGVEKITLHARESRKYVRRWYESLGFVEKKTIRWYYMNEDGIRYEKELE